MPDRPIVLLLSGPNLNLLGEREPEIYGTATLDDHVAAAEAAAAAQGWALEHLQSNHEGELIDTVHHARGRVAAIVINAAAFTHYGWGLHDALAAFSGPVVELHLSNPGGRERWRHRSVITPVATGVISGFGGRRVPAGRRGAGRSGVTDLPASDVAGRLDRLRARIPGGGVRCPPADPPDQHPLPDRLHRLGRPPAGTGRPGALRDRRAVRGTSGRPAGGGRGGRRHRGDEHRPTGRDGRGGRWSRLARPRGRFGHLGPATAVRRGMVPRNEPRPDRRARRGAAPGEGRGGGGPDRGGGHHRRRGARPGATPAGRGPHRAGVRPRARRRHAPPRCRRRVVRDHLRLRPERCPPPCSPRAEAGRRGRSRRARLRSAGRRVPLGHDPHRHGRSSRPRRSGACSRWSQPRRRRASRRSGRRSRAGTSTRCAGP